MRALLTTIILGIVSVNIQAQYFYFNNMSSQSYMNLTENTSNIEILGDQYVTWGGGVDSVGIRYFLQTYDSLGALIESENYSFQDAFIYTGLTNSFLKISNEEAYLFTQAISDSIGVKGVAMKINAELDTLWKKEFNTYGEYTYFYTHAWEEDGFIIAGEIAEQDVGRGTFLMKIDHEGNYLWDAIIHQPQEGVFRNFHITPINNGNLLSGATGGGGDSNGYIEFVNNSNALEWHTTTSGNLANFTIGHQQLYSGEVLAWQSAAYQFLPGSTDPLWAYMKHSIFLLDSLTGELSLLKELFTQNERIQFSSIEFVEEADGYIFAGGELKGQPGSYHRISNIYKLNLDFELEWYTELAYDPCVTCTNQIWDMEKAPDGGYVLAGRFRDTATDPNDKTWLVKVDACGELEYNGCWPVGENELEIPDLKFEIYPNPVQDILNVSLENLPRDISNLECQLTNQLGQMVHSESLRLDHLLSNYSINLTTVPSGLYSLTLRSEGEVLATEKFVKK